MRKVVFREYLAVRRETPRSCYSGVARAGTLQLILVHAEIVEAIAAFHIQVGRIEFAYDPMEYA